MGGEECVRKHPRDLLPCVTSFYYYCKGAMNIKPWQETKCELYFLCQVSCILEEKTEVSLPMTLAVSVGHTPRMCARYPRSIFVRAYLSKNTMTRS